MDIFNFRNQLIGDYSEYVNSFIRIRDERINALVAQELADGVLWPEPLTQLNPFFMPGDTVDQLVEQGVLHEKCRDIFRRDKTAEGDLGKLMRLHRHQEDAIRTARGGHNYILTTGTGSGKSLAYIIPIVDFVLRQGSGHGIKAIVVYPMNALANSQYNELAKFLKNGFDANSQPVRFARYTGQENEEQRRAILADPPDILLTNYVMLELILTRAKERELIAQAHDLRFLVLDEMHTYRGRQGADVAMLVRRVRERTHATQLQCVGTSATVSGTESGSIEQQRSEVATVASKLFGATVRPAHVIGETLKRMTQDVDQSDPAFREALTERVADVLRKPPNTFDTFLRDPLSIWIETKLGVREDPLTRRLVRAEPRSLQGELGIARELAHDTGLSDSQCATALREGLSAGYSCEPNPETGLRPFAFRLHQFISRGDVVHASLEPATDRHVTLQGQQFVPGDRERLLFPVVFCRECGQEYYSVWMKVGLSGMMFRARPWRAEPAEEGWTAGYLYASDTNPWPESDDEAIAANRYPDDWLEARARGAGVRIKQGRKKDKPQTLWVLPNGVESKREAENGLRCQFTPASFKFCLHCCVSYGARQKSDFAKLASLSSEGRSTATTILSLSAIRHLRDSDLSVSARKLLAFTDDRQDASLQAGHFNDFVENGMLRAALYRAVNTAGQAGLSHNQLTEYVFDALNLAPETYAVEPEARFNAKRNTEQALRDVLGYRLYRDLKRGWRITTPNLEQCGLLTIHYDSLGELCQAEDMWQAAHPALVSAAPETRRRVCTVLLDYMRRSLAIKVDYLEPVRQDGIQQQSFQRLISPWAIDENEQLEFAATLYPRPSNDQSNDYGGNVYLSARGGFGQYLRRRGTFAQYASPLPMQDSTNIIRQILEVLRSAGLITVVDPARTQDDVPGYQLLADTMRWVVGDGTRAYHDPISVPNASDDGDRVNAFFVKLYRSAADTLQRMEAREHTAQVPSPDREKREREFRAGNLPVMYCSPTMELGVDISDLNVVGLRNIPPTPANYAQRSGRAGRSGQPALVFAYCSTGNSHDQYFFRRPDRMVNGAVSAPRLDLANESLVRAHVHAIWLAESKLSLGESLKDLLDLSGTSPSLDLQTHVKQALSDTASKQRAQASAARILETIHDDLQRVTWFTSRWLDDVFNQLEAKFEEACGRWRDLYRAAMEQANQQDRVIRDATRSASDRTTAERLRREAEAQLKLLIEVENVAQSDFYSYRYFASEGFLPGYSFPRLPVSAFIQARRTKQNDEFLSRPRFLAISEFGPRAIIYHEGSQYQINKVILPMRTLAEEGNAQLQMRSTKRCTSCGYLHPFNIGGGDDICQRCGAKLHNQMTSLLLMQNVSTRRRDRINSDEEERRRMGYELITGLRFNDHGQQLASRVASVMHDDTEIAKLTFADGATLWRINLGERRRAKREVLGFVLDVERGTWVANSRENQDDNQDDQVDEPTSGRTARVIPFVSDQRNCLLFTPSECLGLSAAERTAWMASMQSALKRAIQTEFQLEDNELTAELLPDNDHPREILFYESAEGGAGVLRRLLDETSALARVATCALDICHFDPETGEDRRHAPHAKENCEAACYDCLMGYHNQRDHRLLDRKLIQPALMALRAASISASPTPLARNSHLEQLLRQCGSDLEREWLRFLEVHNRPLPSHAQKLIEQCSTRPDFWYASQSVAVYVDGPHHEFPERVVRDTTQTACLDDLGIPAIRFGHRDDWSAIVALHPDVFGASAA